MLLATADLDGLLLLWLSLELIGFAFVLPYLTYIECLNKKYIL